jgi:Mrp family chromosome partitioning ATPase
MAEVLEALEARADVVIIDGPPFIIADAPILASKVDGVLLIIRIGHSREPAIKSMMEQIDRAGAKVVGVALNRLPPKGIGYYAGTPYYSAYYSDEQESSWNMNQQRGWRDRLSFWPFNSRSKSKSSTRRVFDQIDVVDGDGEEYGWGE